MSFTESLSPRARELIDAFDPRALTRIDETLHPIAPHLVERLVKSIYEDAYQRDGLSFRERHIATLSALVAFGDTERQLRFQGHAAFRHGFTWRDIEEILIQNAAFCGFSRAINAALVLNEAYHALEAEGEGV